MGIDTAIVGSAILLALLWPIHQQLELRALRHSLRRMHERQAQHARALVHLQTTMANTPLQVHAPMPRVGRAPAQAALRSVPRNASPGPETCIDPDATLRLGRPPSLSDIEGVLDHAGRDLTATEIAARLDRKPWDLIADIDRLIKAGKIQTVPGHTAGRTAYRLAGPPDPTERIPGGMPILWGAR